MRLQCDRLRADLRIFDACLLLFVGTWKLSNHYLLSSHAPKRVWEEWSLLWMGRVNGIASPVTKYGAGGRLTPIYLLIYPPFFTALPYNDVSRGEGGLDRKRGRLRPTT